MCTDSVVKFGAKVLDLVGNLFFQSEMLFYSSSFVLAIFLYFSGLVHVGAQMAASYGRGAPAPSVPASYGRGGVTGETLQSQPFPTSVPAQPSAPSERCPSPPQQPKGPQVDWCMSFLNLISMGL